MESPINSGQRHVGDTSSRFRKHLATACYWPHVILGEYEGSSEVSLRMALGIQFKAQHLGFKTFDLFPGIIWKSHLSNLEIHSRER